MFACVRSPRMPEIAVAVAKTFSPRFQRHGHGCVVLDVSGLGRLLGSPQAIAAELDRAWTSLADSRNPRTSPRERSARVAIAPTQVGALLLSLAWPTVTVVTEELGAVLASLPLPMLRRLLGETDVRSDGAEHAFEVLERWGVETLGGLTRLPAGDLSARLGQEGVALQRLASGIDPGPLVPDPDAPRFVERLELEWPIDGLEPLAFVLARLLDPLSASLERADRAAAAIRLDLRLVDRSTHTRQLQLPAAMRDPRVLRTLLVLDLESHPPGAAIDIVTVEIDPAPGRVVQFSLLERARPSAETLATLTARLSALAGESRSGAPALLDSYGPDAFEVRRFAPDDRPAATRGPIDLVHGARTTQRSAIDALCLRRFRPPIAIRVTVERGRPVRVAIDRRGMPGGPVDQSAGPWRSSGSWWDGQARRWDRDEWDVAFDDGTVCRLFQDRQNERWFLEGVFD